MARYTIRQLEFVEAAGDCNFARTAERLGISQPAVSDHIRALERNLGAALFARRRGTRVVLTGAGEVVPRGPSGPGSDSEPVAAQRGALGTRAREDVAGPHIFERMLRAALPETRRDDQRPEVHTVAAFLKGILDLGQAA